MRGLGLRLLGQPRLAQAVEQVRDRRAEQGHEFDREFGFEAARFRQGGLRLVHLACEAHRRRPDLRKATRVHAEVDRLVVVVDSGVELPEAEFRVAQILESN